LVLSPVVINVSSGLADRPHPSTAPCVAAGAFLPYHRSCHQRAASRRLGVDRPDFGRGGFSLGRFHIIKTENISDNVLKITAPEKGLGAHDAAVLMIDTSIIRVISTVPALLGTEHSRCSGQEAG
jgi:hypothetical protein